MLVRWDPFNELNNLQRDLNRVFANAAAGDGGTIAPLVGTKSWMPAVDITENESAITVNVELPGMDQKDIDIHLEEGYLNIKGEKKFEKEEKGDNYLRKEMSYGSFHRAFHIPCPIQDDNVEANYKDGVLSIVLPKEQKVQPKKIEIK